MARKSIKYVAFFDTQDSLVKRNYVMSAVNKLSYITKVISSIGYEIEIISVSEVIEKQFKLYPSEEKYISEGIKLRLPLSWGGNSFFLRKIKVIWHLIDIFFYLLFHCSKNDIVIVYHSLGYFDIIRWAKKICKFKMILEVEEIYSDVSRMSRYLRNLEFKMFDIADAFILSNDLLNAKINKYSRPFSVIYGTYQIEPRRVQNFNDGKVHVVYAGTFDPNKGGAQSAIQAAEYLSEKFHMHICGFGNPQDIESVKNQIKKIQKFSKATITYDGLKKGNEFIEFLQRCHIGLSSQKPEGEYNDTSFPSKILTYMANGLSVVSIRIPVLERSPLSHVLSFYEEPTGQSLANAILKCDHNRSSRDLLEKLDQQFKDHIKLIIDE